MGPTPRPGIMDIKPYKGGASATPGFENPIKLSSNENALGCSEKAKAAFTGLADKLALYPDGSASALRAAIAERYDLDPARIVCGAGSDELLQLLTRAYAGPGDEILQSQYGFLVYKLAALQVGATPVFAAETDFRADVDALLAAVSVHTKIVFLANPNNPTGSYLPMEEIERLRAGLPEGVLLVLDAAYAEFVDLADYGDGFDMVTRREDVVVTRTFSKIHGLAALRLGWAYCPEAIAGVLNRLRGPFNVNAPALAAGLAAVQDREFAQASADHNRRELARVTEGLEKLQIRFAPSVGNFVLLHFSEAPGRTAQDADHFLRSRGIIVRDVAAYGLPQSLRVSIGREAENTAVLAALADFQAGAA
ncbi:MAG: histidinol-phosphate transaminase [Maricaulaceae bacterium]